MRCALCGGEFEDLRIDESTGIVACETCHKQVNQAAEEDYDGPEEDSEKHDNEDVEEE